MQAALILGTFNPNKSYGIFKEPTLGSDGCIRYHSKRRSKALKLSNLEQGHALA